LSDGTLIVSDPIEEELDKQDSLTKSQPEQAEQIVDGTDSLKTTQEEQIEKLQYEMGEMINQIDMQKQLQRYYLTIPCENRKQIEVDGKEYSIYTEMSMAVDGDGNCYNVFCLGP